MRGLLLIKRRWFGSREAFRGILLRTRLISIIVVVPFLRTQGNSIFCIFSVNSRFKALVSPELWCHLLVVFIAPVELFSFVFHGHGRQQKGRINFSGCLTLELRLKVAFTRTISVHP
jgi:hypothetical protein